MVVVGTVTLLAGAWIGTSKDDIKKVLAGSTMSLADLAAAAQISVADYLGGIDWSGHEQARGWYSVFKSRPSFRPLLAERMDVIQPPSHYADVNA